MKHHKVEQNTDEWFQLRAGKITMSKLNVVMAKYPNAFGDPAKKYAIDLAVEQITGKPVKSSYSNSAMEQGHILEPVAIAKYEQTTFSEVKPGGFFCDDKIGASPDGLVGEGLLEVKSSITTHAHYERVRKQAVDSAYRWQIAGTLLYTGKPWVDFCSYCEDFPMDKQLFIIRIYASQLREEFKLIKARIAKFLELVAESKEIIEKGEYFNA